MNNRKAGVKTIKIGGYAAVASAVVPLIPGLNKLPIEIGAFAVASVLRVVEEVIKRKFKIDIFG